MNKHAVKLLVGLLAISLALFVVHLGLKYISVVIYQEKHGSLFELSNRFDMNDESSVPQWFTLAGFLAIALGAFMAAFLAKRADVRRLWGAIAVIALLLSVDDVATLHEYVLQTLHNSLFLDTAPTFIRNAWFVLMPVVLLISGWLFVQAVRLLPRRTMLSLAIGSIIFLVGAVLFDSVANTLPPRSFAEQGIAAGIEGWLQLIGLSVLIYAICDYLEKQHGKTITGVLKQLKV